MQNTVIPRGVPLAILRDGWWLDVPITNTGTSGGGDAPGQGRTGFLRLGTGLLLLVILADALFWDRGFGVSLALFSLAVFGVATRDIQRPARFGPVVVAVLGVLPVADNVQLLSLLFLAASLVIALIWARHPQAKATALLWGGLAFVGRLPLRWVSPLQACGAGQLRQTLRFFPAPRLVMRNWAFPIGGTLVLLALLMEANPMLARLFRFDLDLWAAAERVVFWTGIAFLIAPFLSQNVALAGPMHGTRSRQLPQMGLNAGSVLRALMMFNLLIGVQMVTDMSILIGGADLPSGLTYADYAHRGAYPLLATAILAGAFALAARPFLGEHRLIRPLMLLWLGQNVILCGAAALRLELYIQAYGLTYLRTYALIWMGLVAVGLMLTLWQVLFDRATAWLLGRAAALGLATLYLCSFVNFAHIIAAQNLDRERPDMPYICDLGPMAAGAVAHAIITRPDHLAAVRGQRPCPALRPQTIRHWQEWGFRKWSVGRYTAEVTQRSALNENPDRR